MSKPVGIQKDIRARNRIITAAQNLVACIQHERDLKAEIDWKACEFYEESEMFGEDATGYPGREPCPFLEIQSGEVTPFDDGKTKLPREDWCATCERNVTLQAAVKVHRHKRTGYLRTLTNVVTALDRIAAERKEGL